MSDLLMLHKTVILQMTGTQISHARATLLTINRLMPTPGSEDADFKAPLSGSNTITDHAGHFG